MTTPTTTPNRWMTPSPFTSRFEDDTPAFKLSTPLSPLKPTAMEFSPPRKRSVDKNFESPLSNKTNQFAKQSGRFPKSAGKENSPPKFNFADLCPEEDAFSETAGSSIFAQYKRPSTPEKEKTQSHTSAPLTKAEQEITERFKRSKQIWKKMAVTHGEIGKGKGNFHKVFDDAANGQVFKVPNDKYKKKSKHTVDSVPICFVHVQNASKNYSKLQSIKLPGLLKLAKTEFNIENAIITQEKWDAPFVPERDLKNEAVHDTIKAVLQLLADGKLPDIDFRPANLGWKNGELKLFDFLEERDNKSIHTLKQFANEFASEFEKRGNEIVKKINQPLYRSLLPTPKVQLHLR